MILFIDDENIIRITVKKLLAECGYEVIVAEDGESGIAAYKQNRDTINLVIIDMSMKKMNGKETYLLLKEINPEIKVIISSGFRIDERIEETLRCGAVDFIAKPFTRSELIEVVKKHI